MTPFSLMTPNGRSQFFQQAILINVQFWRAWLVDKMSDPVALQRERSRLIKAITFALDIDEAWPAVYELIVSLTPYMTQHGYTNIWARILRQAIATAQRKGDHVQLVALSVILAWML